jgi:hypothetical protein
MHPIFKRQRRASNFQKRRSIIGSWTFSLAPLSTTLTGTPNNTNRWFMKRRKYESNA